MNNMASTTVKSAAAVGLLALIASIGVLVSNLQKVDEAKFAWDQSAIVKDASGNPKVLTLEESSQLQFRVYIDNSTVAKDMSGVVCTSLSAEVFLCSVELKSLGLTPTIHTLQLTTIYNGVESEKSAPLEVNFLVTTNK